MDTIRKAKPELHFWSSGSITPDDENSDHPSPNLNQ